MEQHTLLILVRIKGLDTLTICHRVWLFGVGGGEVGEPYTQSYHWPLALISLSFTPTHYFLKVPDQSFLYSNPLLSQASWSVFPLLLPVTFSRFSISFSFTPTHSFLKVPNQSFLYSYPLLSRFLISLSFTPTRYFLKVPNQSFLYSYPLLSQGSRSVCPLLQLVTFSGFLFSGETESIHSILSISIIAWQKQQDYGSNILKIWNASTVHQSVLKFNRKPLQNTALMHSMLQKFSVSSCAALQTQL